MTSDLTNILNKQPDTEKPILDRIDNEGLKKSWQLGLKISTAAARRSKTASVVLRTFAYMEAVLAIINLVAGHWISGVVFAGLVLFIWRQADYYAQCAKVWELHAVYDEYGLSAYTWDALKHCVDKQKRLTAYTNSWPKWRNLVGWLQPLPNIDHL